MANNIVKMLATCLAIGAVLSVGTDFALARPGGGGSHIGGGGGHFSGGHFGGARMGASRVGVARIHGTPHIHNLSRARIGATRNSTAHINAAHVRAVGASSMLGGHAAWNQWGNRSWSGSWNGGWGGWAGPVFWPYFYGDLFGFVFWPYAYYDPFWAYGDIFVWDALFWPGPDYAYATPYDDFYAGYGVYGGYSRTRTARSVGRETTGSISNSHDLTQSCGGLAPGVTDLPIDRIEKAINLTDEQFKALDALKAASSQASDALKASCPSEIPMTPVARLDTVQKRVDAMIQALGIVRTPLDDFFNSLNEEQRQRFAALGANARAIRSGPASGNDLAALCSRRAESFTQLPTQRVEQVVKPTQQQLDAFDKLKAASDAAVNQLQASCPTEMPQTPLDRFDAVGKRLDAMAEAIKTVRPALADFYASLTDEQKARFNMLRPPQTQASHRG
jgi:hypothetical protein